MLKEIDHITLYHPKFSLSFLRINEQVAWKGMVEDNHTTPAALKQVYGYWVNLEDHGFSVYAAVTALIQDAAKTFSPLIGMTSDDIIEYLVEQVEIINHENSKVE